MTCVWLFHLLSDFFVVLSSFFCLSWFIVDFCLRPSQTFFLLFSFFDCKRMDKHIHTDGVILNHLLYHTVYFVML